MNSKFQRFSPGLIIIVLFFTFSGTVHAQSASCGAPGTAGWCPVTGTGYAVYTLPGGLPPAFNPTACMSECTSKSISLGKSGICYWVGESGVAPDNCSFYTNSTDQFCSLGDPGGRGAGQVAETCTYSPPAACPATTVTWGACSATRSSQASGFSGSVTNTAANHTGSEITTCSKGTWSYSSPVCNVNTCTSSPNACGHTVTGACPQSPPPNPTGYGNSCTSAANSCGTKNTGTIGCTGACSATTPPNPTGYGNACHSAANACGATGSGTIGCTGACSASVPALPSGYGNSCTSAPNACGAKNTGTIGCSGACSATTPANPSGYGNSCKSAPNACGQTNTGTITCSGSCSATTPSNSSCPPAVTATLTASPNPVAYNGRTTLSWGSTGATSCWAGGPWSNSGSLSGSGLSDALTSATTFTFQCTGPGGTSPLRSVTVSVNASPPPPPLGCSATIINHCSLSSVASGATSGSCVSGYTNGSCNYKCTNGAWTQNYNTCQPFPPPLNCPATTINHCVLAATVSGGNSGTCSSGYLNSCNYSCNNGNWTQNTNFCSLPASCSSKDSSWGSGCSATQGAQSSGYSGTLNNTAAGHTGSETATCSNGNWSFTNPSCSTTACPNGANNSPACNVCTPPNVYNGSSCVGPISIIANPVSDLTLPNTTFTEQYNLSGGTSVNTNCRLLDSSQNPLTSYAPCSGSIAYNTPAVANSYGYYVQANKSSTGETKISNKFTVNVNAAASCPNGANNPPACNVCTSPQVWNGSSCVNPPPPTSPTASLSANPDTINTGQSATLTWSSTNADSCTSAGGFSTGNATSGNTSTGALTSTQTYQISCTGPGGTANSSVVVVTVDTPTATIGANPTQVVPGGSTVISWSSTDVTSCVVTKNGTVWSNLSNSNGTTDSDISGTVTYTLTCHTAAGPDATDSVTVIGSSQFQEF